MKNKTKANEPIQPRIKRGHAARLLSVTTRTLQRWETKGLLHATQLNSRTYVYPETEVRALLAGKAGAK